MRTFKHRGAHGDIIYSLPMVISSGGGEFYVVKGNQYNFLCPLLEKQPYLKQVKYGKGYRVNPNTINLDLYREVANANPHMNLPSIYLQIFNKSYDLSKPWLMNIDSKFISNIIINRSSKYHNNNDFIDYSVLRRYENQSCFIGLERDYLFFKDKYNIKMPFYKVENALQMAQIIKGSKLFIGNQSFCFSLAEAMKHPRVLEVYSGKSNCLPNSSNGHVVLTEEIINNNLNDRFSLSTIISKKDIEKSSVLDTMFKESNKTTVFLPNYGEFGSLVHKLIRLVHYHKANKKIVCCKRGEESLFPTADKFYYDWVDCVEDIHKWGFFSKRSIQGVKNHKYREYQNIISEDFENIKKKFRENCNYIHLWKFNKDTNFNKYSHHFRVPLKPRVLKNIKADIVITPRNRKSRSENNFLKWQELIDFFNEKGHTVGCVGSEEQSFHLQGDVINSWDYEDNSGAVIEMINNCKLFIGIDTGVTHLASMMSIPMIVFSDANQRHYLTDFMRDTTVNYFVDLGKNVQNIDIIKKSSLDFLDGLK